MKTFLTISKKALIILFLLTKALNAQISHYATPYGNSEKDVVRAIFIDSHNVKWIGTDSGLCRYNDTIWQCYTTADKIGNPPINGLAYQRTKYGDEIWIATAKGASVAAYNIDGITGATNYTKDKFPMLDDSIVSVVVDTSGNRFFASKNGITWFKGNKWGIITHDTFPDYIPSEPILSLYARYDTLYIGSKGYGIAKGGVGRIISEIDGYTGASIIQGPYCGNLNNAVHAIFVDSKARQWFGTEEGLFEHEGQNFKGEGWLRYFSKENGLAGDTIFSIEESHNQNIWVGTNEGLNVITNDTIFTLSYKNGKLLGKCVYDIAFDTSGIGWLATDRGIVSVDEKIFNTVNASLLSHNTFMVYPNPTYGLINIQFPEKITNGHLYLIDIHGRIILQQKLTSNNKTLDLNNYAIKGIYFLHINTDKGKYVKKILLY